MKTTRPCESGLLLPVHALSALRRPGLGSGITDIEYAGAGAQIAEAAEVWTKSELLLKVKEPLPFEYQYLRPDLTLFTYLHLAPEKDLTVAMLHSGLTAIGYETVQLDSEALPLLEPMSEVAGKMSVQVGAQFLARHDGVGAGMMLGGVPGVPAAHVAIIGGGMVGTCAAKVAVGMGARVTVLDIRVDMRYLDDIFGSRIATVAANPFTIAEAVRDADLLIGAVLIAGEKTPVLVSEEMVKSMRPGSVIVDVAIDQGGSIETVDRVTDHVDPIYLEHGVIHYAVANMPGAVPRTSTYALTNATLPYATQLANLGWEEACRRNQALARGVNIARGQCTCQGVAEAQQIAFTPIASLL